MALTGFETMLCAHTLVTAPLTHKELLDRLLQAGQDARDAQLRIDLKMPNATHDELIKAFVHQTSERAGHVAVRAEVWDDEE